MKTRTDCLVARRKIDVMGNFKCKNLLNAVKLKMVFFDDRY